MRWFSRKPVEMNVLHRKWRHLEKRVVAGVSIAPVIPGPGEPTASGGILRCPWLFTVGIGFWGLARKLSSVSAEGGLPQRPFRGGEDAGHCCGSPWRSAICGTDLDASLVSIKTIVLRVRKLLDNAQP